MLENLDLEFLDSVSRRAGDEILDVYGTEFSVDVKEDKSPLTEADQRANAVIVEALEERYSEVPIIYE